MRPSPIYVGLDSLSGIVLQCDCPQVVYGILAIPGLRLGWAWPILEIAQKVRRLLPPWSVQYPGPKGGARRLEATGLRDSDQDRGKKIA